MTKEKHNCDNVNCNHNDTKGLCCLFNPDNCKYRQLQKENERLTVSYETLKLHDEEEIGMLKKENAELKARLNAINLLTPELEKVSKLRRQQLTKAKEIINGLLSFVDSLGNYSGGIFAKAEQFLSEVEK